MKHRSEIKLQAKKNFLAQYGICVGAFVLIAILLGAISWFGGLSNVKADFHTGIIVFYPYIGAAVGFGLISLAATVLLVPPLTVGYASFGVRIYRGQTGDIGDMFNNGFSNYWRNVGGMVWMYLFTFLWTLLFFIPGIIKAIAYSMTPYILAEGKNVEPTEAIKISMCMTKGYKGRIFVMFLSFIGWWILTGITAGLLAIFFTGPYFSTSMAGLYEELKNNALAGGTVTAEQLT